jgi:hypothetical protein
VRTPELRDAGASNNPNREFDDQYLTTEQASDYLREKKNIHLTAGTLTLRRSFGKAPKFLKISQAVRYRPADLDEFARTMGLKGLPERQPERTAQSAKK